MTVKFSSLHIKWKSLLTFPQTEEAEHWHRGGKWKCVKSRILLEEKTFRSQAAHTRMQVMNLALVSGSQFESPNSEKQQKLSLTLGDRWQMAACKIHWNKPERGEERWFEESFRSDCVLCECRVQRVSHRISNPASSFTHSVQLSTKCSWMPPHIQFHTSLLLSHMWRLTHSMTAQHYSRHSHEYSFEVSCWQWVTHWQ